MNNKFKNISTFAIIGAFFTLFAIFIFSIDKNPINKVTYADERTDGRFELNSTEEVADSNSESNRTAPEVLGVSDSKENTPTQSEPVNQQPENNQNQDNSNNSGSDSSEDNKGSKSDDDKKNEDKKPAENKREKLSKRILELIGSVFQNSEN